jgi:hypothetical protein
MTAIEIAANWQRKHSTEKIEDRIAWHFARGLVWSTPDCFMLASEVRYDNEQICGGEPNAWFVELGAATEACANPVREFMRVAPWEHEYALWRRNNEPRVRAFSWDKLKRKVGLN